ncbi:MAG: hypothetical protein P8N58_01685 [Emcibacteraceae bacterium]|nr:hypothetical protein [Emcibacteraceae bacterium]
MKYFFLIFASIFLINSSYAEKLSLVCHAFSFEIQPELNKPLKNGQVRFAGQTLAGFIDTDDYSIAVTQECESKNDQKVCLASGDSNYCPKPSSKFKFRHIRDDGSISMISDRCEGSWTKYQLIGEILLDGVNYKSYLEHQVYFQLKNQIIAGIKIARDKPVFLIGGKSVDKYPIRLVSFRKEMWQVDQYDPLRKQNIKAQLEYYESGMHESLSLTSICIDK